MQDSKNILFCDLSQIEKLAVQTVGKYNVYLLNGEVGAGKSTFVKHCLSVLNLEYLGSPTFNLVHEYHYKPKIVHMDLYRLDKKDAANLLEEYLIDIESLMLFIEWPIKELEHILPIDKTLKICFLNR